jgi:rsbT co-antagonist protein RsbR
MSIGSAVPIRDLISKHEDDILKEWIELQMQASTLRRDLLSDAELRHQSARFLSAMRSALEASDGAIDPTREEWLQVRTHLAELSRSRARQGFSPGETATFVLSLKQPLFTRLQATAYHDIEGLVNALWLTTELIDQLGLYTSEMYQKGREDVIGSQQQELLELSTPVVTLWDGVLALPLIGTLDSARTQVVMENLLNRIVETGAGIAIIDITGVPIVDTLVAQHLLKTIAAARLMGAECILSGIRPQIAQTIVQLGVDLGDVVTKASLGAAFAVAFERLHLTVTDAEHHASVRLSPRTPPSDR